jgi:hypothetical protein
MNPRPVIMFGVESKNRKVLQLSLSRVLSYYGEARLSFLWVAVPMVFGIGVWQVYLSEEVFLLMPSSPRLYTEAESTQIDSKKQSALSKGTRKRD